MDIENLQKRADWLDLNDETTKQLLRRLGADPDNPPPPPMKINISQNEIPKRMRGWLTMIFGDRDLRLSVKLDGINPDVGLRVERLVKDGKITTHAGIVKLLTDLASAQE